MSKYTKLENNTLVSGTTSTGQFLVAEINRKLIGLPYFTFEPFTTVPDIDFVELLSTEIELYNSTVVNTATSYTAGVAITVNGSAYAWPLFKVDQSATLNPNLVFWQPTLVANLTSTGLYTTIKIDNVGYGIPLYTYSSQFPFTTSAPLSSITVTTIIEQGPPVLDRNAESVTEVGSTNLNPKIRTYAQLINRVKYALGYPFVNLEVCDDTQIVDFIDQAIEWYTKYAGYTEEFLVFKSDLYTEPGLRIDKLFSMTTTMRSTNTYNVSGAMDYDLGDYRKVVGVFSFEPGETTGINTLFTLEQAMAQQTYFSYMLGNVGFDLVTWEVLKGWLKLREKVLAQRHYVDFDQRNQLLRLIPAPNANSRFFGAVGCFVEKPLKDLIMERWIYQYTIALTKIAIGNVRGKYQGMSLFGGGSVNYSDLLNQGLQEKQKLEEELMNSYGEVTPPRFFIG